MKSGIHWAFKIISIKIIFFVQLVIKANVPFHKFDKFNVRSYALITSVFRRSRLFLFTVPEGVEDHSEEDEFTKKRYHE